MGRASVPKVAILMGTCNGGRFLRDQLESIQRQTHPNWIVIASDDGSVDSTKTVLFEFLAMWGPEKISVQCGPRKGFARNFLELACAKDIHADYYAYCDQDDVWDSDKLTRALAWLESVPFEFPALYCGRTRLINREGVDIGYSPLFRKPPSFGNALVQSIAGGNTMVMNESARRLLQAVGPTIPVVSHDWWTYLAVSACGGIIFYDPHPTVRYRQHAGNLVGMNVGLGPKFRRMTMLLGGTFKQYTDANLGALTELSHLMAESSKETLEAFYAIRHRRFPLWLPFFFRHDFRRQTLAGTLALIFAAIVKKI